MENKVQKILSAEQIAAFYHDCFVQNQVDHFAKISLQYSSKGFVVVDVGGGCGYFASALAKEFNIQTRVIDMDPVSVDAAKKIGLDAVIGDALNPVINTTNDRVACFNLILHHLVGDSEEATMALQLQAISAWNKPNIKVFVNEYIYESWFNNFSGWLIYKITKSKFLSSIGRRVSTVFPSLKANTFGVGVRFRSNKEWRDVFKMAGFVVINELRGEREFVSIPRRLLLIRETRRDSFILAPQ